MFIICFISSKILLSRTFYDSWVINFKKCIIFSIFISYESRIIKTTLITHKEQYFVNYLTDKCVGKYSSKSVLSARLIVFYHVYLRAQKWKFGLRLA